MEVSPVGSQGYERCRSEMRRVGGIAGLSSTFRTWVDTITRAEKTLLYAGVKLTYID